MIDINLLPPEFGPRKAITPINLIIIFLSFFICLSLLLSSMRLLNTLQDYSIRVDYHDKQIKLYEKQAMEIRRLATKVKELRGRLDLVEELLQEKTTWSDKLVELAQCLPQHGAWINTLTVERQKPAPGTPQATPPQPGAPPAEPAPQPVIAYVEGSVVSVEQISQFVAELEGSATFGNIFFDSATVDTDEAKASPFMAFKLSVELMALKTGS
jgi:Tfp pilus assembly protein PilN